MGCPPLASRFLPNTPTPHPEPVVLRRQAEGGRDEGPIQRTPLWNQQCAPLARGHALRHRRALRVWLRMRPRGVRGARGSGRRRWRLLTMSMLGNFKPQSSNSAHPEEHRDSDASRRTEAPLRDRQTRPPEKKMWRDCCTHRAPTPRHPPQPPSPRSPLPESPRRSAAVRPSLRCRRVGWRHTCRGAVPSWPPPAG